jgi:L-methionine (R)-S-oxide reductase
MALTMASHSATPQSPSQKRIAQYLLAANLPHLHEHSAQIEAALFDLLDAVGELPAEVAPEGLYNYPVPLLSEDGSCSLIEELSPTPYNLTPRLGEPNSATVRRLLLLRQLVSRVMDLTGSDWFGVYQARGAKPQRALVKLAYLGRPSRAEFPLTTDFAKGSTNATVGLSGEAKIIDDVAAYTAQGGGFYVCDDAVKSEACLPLFNFEGTVSTVLGIMDAEASPIEFYNVSRQCVLVAAALVAPAFLPD